MLLHELSKIVAVKEFITLGVKIGSSVESRDKKESMKVKEILTTEGLGIRKICGKVVPNNLTEQQREARLSAVFDIQMHYGEAAASLLTLSRTLRLLFISKSKIGRKRKPF